MVPGAGIEPARLAAGDFESPASTNFATWASDEARILNDALLLSSMNKKKYTKCCFYMDIF